MTPRWHAAQFRRLIDACGGLNEAAPVCRVSKSLLSRYQTPGSGVFAPADVIMELEAYCGEPVYSAAIAKARPSAPISGDLLALGCVNTEEASDVQRAIREAVADGKLTPREIEAERRAAVHAALAGGRR